MTWTLFELSQRMIGMKEVPGIEHNSLVMRMLKLDQAWPDGDEVPWCSAFVNFLCWWLGLERSKNLRARSWLGVGIPVALDDALPGYDVVIFTRGSGPQPPATVLDAPGHVAIYAGRNGDGDVVVIGGNQSNEVSVATYSKHRVLGVRRLSVAGDD